MYSLKRWLVIVLSSKRLISLNVVFRCFCNWFQSDKHLLIIENFSIFLSFKIAFSQQEGTSWSCILVIPSWGLLKDFVETCHFLIYQWLFHKDNVLKSNKSFNFSIFNCFIFLRKYRCEEISLFLLLSPLNWKVADKYLFSDLLFWIFVSIYRGSYADSNGIYFLVW